MGADRWRLERESRSEEERVGADTVDRNWCRVATTPTRGLVWECEWGPVETLGVVREEWAEDRRGGKVQVVRFEWKSLAVEEAGRALGGLQWRV